MKGPADCLGSMSSDSAPAKSYLVTKSFGMLNVTGPLGRGFMERCWIHFLLMFWSMVQPKSHNRVISHSTGVLLMRLFQMESKARWSKQMRHISMPNCNRNSIKEENVSVVMILVCHPLALHRWLYFGCILEQVSLSHPKICPSFCLYSCGCSLKCPAELFI